MVADLLGDLFISNGPTTKNKNQSDNYLSFPKLIEMAQLKDKTSGRKLTVSSTSRGLQIYTANYLNDNVIGRGNQKYKIHQGICLETGEFPNSPAEPSFPSTVISADRPFKSTTIFQFSTEKYGEE